MSASSVLRLLPTVCLVALLFPAPPAQAQSASDTTANVRPPAFQKGGWGLQYEATSLDGALSGFQGSLFSGRYHFSDRQALRVGISVNASTEDREELGGSRRDTLGMDSPERRSERDAQDYELSAEYVHYVTPADRLFLFASVGPQAGYSTYRDEDEIPNDDRLLIRERKSESYRLGIGAAVGVEWFVHSHISLSVEYPLRLEYVHERDEMIRTVQHRTGERRTEEIFEVDRYEAGGESVRIGVTFSFGP